MNIKFLDILTYKNKGVFDMLQQLYELLYKIPQNIFLSYICVFLLILLTYVISKPLIKVFIRMEHILLLTFMMCSLITLFLISFASSIHEKYFSLFVVLLHCLIIFGGVLIGRRVYLYMKHKFYQS